MQPTTTITLAIPTFKNRISARLDCAETILLVKIENGSVLSRETVHLPPQIPIGKLHMLEELGVNILICGGVTETCVKVLSETKIRVIPWVQGEVEIVLRRFLSNELSSPPRHETKELFT